MAETLPLLPRFRRPLTFGGVLDETFRLYRSAWTRLMAVTALASIPGGIVVVVLGGTTFLTVANLVTAGDDVTALTRTLTGLGLGIFLASAVYGLGLLVAHAGVTVMTGWLTRGQEHSVWEALGSGVRRLPVLIGSSIVYGLGTFGLTLLALPFAVLGVGIVGGLIALLAVIVWVNRPAGRRPAWLKWLMILATPFGLPIYYGVRWSLSIPAIMLERAGPVAALRRSAALVKGNWFPVAGIWLVLSIVVGILQSIPGAIIGLLALVLGLNSGDPQGPGLIVNVANSAASVVGSVLFGALSFIAATIMFIDLRNRHEGTDLDERLDLLQPQIPLLT